MWLLLDTKTVTRLDYYGQPYETTVFDDPRREEWESTIEKLLESRWPLDQDDIEKINSGKTVKVYSENGRRCLDITKIN